MKIDYDFRINESVDCKIKEGWVDTNKTGQYFGNIVIKGVKWAVVLWDGESDPDFFKANGLLLSSLTKEQWEYLLNRCDESASGKILVPTRLIEKYRKFSLDYDSSNSKIRMKIIDYYGFY